MIKDPVHSSTVSGLISVGAYLLPFDSAQGPPSDAPLTVCKKLRYFFPGSQNLFYEWVIVVYFRRGKRDWFKKGVFVVGNI